MLALAVGLSFAPMACGDARSKDWTEFYVGLSGGVDAIVSDLSADAAGASFDASGLGGGNLGMTLRVGGDYQVNSWFVVGAFAQYDWSNIDTQAAITLGADTLRAEILRLEKAWAVGGRAGFLLSPSLLAYGVLGYTEVTFGDMGISGGGQSISFELPEGHGVMTGLGFEHRLTPSLSFTGEYRASFLEEEDLGGLKVESVLHAARLGLALRFGDVPSSEPAEDAVTASAARAWTGFYAGIGLGADAVVGDITMEAPALGMSAAATGLGGGDIGWSATVGYDHAIAPKLIVGPFVTFDQSAQDIQLETSAMGLTATIDLPSIDYMVTGGMRAGVLASDETLIYALLGYTRMEFTDLELTSSLGPLAKFKSESYSGFTFGGGVERRIGHGLSLRAEYRFVDLDAEVIDAVAGVYTIAADPDLHTGRLMLSYRP
jgi:outer membrane immunogenic protein